MAELAPVQLDGQPDTLTVEQRLAAIEARLDALEKHGHNIPLETVNEIAAHVVRKMSDHLRQSIALGTPER